MTGISTPWMLAFATVGCTLFLLVFLQHVNSGPRPKTRLLQANIWIITICGCALAVLHREAPEGGLHAAIVLGGTAVVLAIFIVAFTSAQGDERGPHGGLVAIAWLFSGVELIYMAVGPATVGLHPEIAASLFFFPGIVTQIWLSNSSKDDLLELAYRVTLFVTVTSLLFGAFRPLFPPSDVPLDVRRFQIGPLLHRLSGVTPHPNYLSVTAVFCILLALHLRVRYKLVIVAVGVGAIVAAESRTALASLFVAGFVSWVARSKRPLARFVVTAPFVLVGLIWSGALLPDLETRALGADVSDNGRYRVWDAVWDMFKQDPWAGFGPTAFQPDSQSPYVAVGLSHAHNQILQGLAEAGWIGGLLTLALLVSIIRIGTSNPSHGIYAAIAAVVITNCMTEPFVTMHLYGLNYAVVVPALTWVVMMSAPIKSRDLGRVHLRSTYGSRFKSDRRFNYET